MIVCLFAIVVLLPPLSASSSQTRLVSLILSQVGLFVVFLIVILLIIVLVGGVILLLSIATPTLGLVSLVSHFLTVGGLSLRFCPCRASLLNWIAFLNLLGSSLLASLGTLLVDWLLRLLKAFVSIEFPLFALGVSLLFLIAGRLCFHAFCSILAFLSHISVFRPWLLLLGGSRLDFGGCFLLLNLVFWSRGIGHNSILVLWCPLRSWV